MSFEAAAVKVEPYSAYAQFDFDIPCFPEGDSMARYRVRNLSELDICDVHKSSPDLNRLKPELQLGLPPA